MNIKYDVVIVGGGTSGCACAYTCSKLGLKTLLVEKNNYLGGLMTGGLVVPVMKSSVEDINCEYYKMLVKSAKESGAQITYKDGNDGWFNPEYLKIVLSKVLTSDNIRKNLNILFETEPIEVQNKDRILKTLTLSSHMLSIPIESRYFIDATGLGKLCILSGCEFLTDNNIKQQNSLRFILGNINTEKFCEFIKSINDNEDITNTYQNDVYTNNELHFTTASTWDNNKIWALDKYLKIAVNDGVLFDSDRSYFQIFSVAGAPGQVAFNCPRLNNYSDNPYKASIELTNGYAAIERLINFAKRYFPGFEKATLVNISPITGVREERRIKSKYIYTKEDLLSGKTFKNAVLSANYSIDIHSDKKDSSVLQKTANYQLPIESLMSAGIDNLFAIGKLVGADFTSHSALRVQKSCMSMGEGVAKYIRNLI